MPDNQLPQEQGATRRSARRIIIPDNDNVLGEVRKVGLGEAKRPLGAAPQSQFGQLIEDATTVNRMRRVAGAALDVAGLGVRVSPYGRVLNTIDLLLMLEPVIDRLQKRGIPPVPADPNPSRERLLDLNWMVDANWAPPFAADYQQVHAHRLNPTTGASNHSNENIFGGSVLPDADWSSVHTGDEVAQIVSGARSDLGDFPAGEAYFDQGHAIRTETSGDPFVSTPGDEVIAPFRGWPEPDPNAMRRQLTEPVVEFGSEPEQGVERIFDTSGRQLAVSPRRPPKRDTKEKKYLTRAARFMAALFGGLDAISENAEIVDNFYDALPKATRDAYEKELGFRWMHLRSGKWVKVPPKALKRGLLDKAGQYGIDGADWKAKALWRYWDQVDTEAAFKNIINNQTQDFVYGNIYKNTPKNMGSALDGTFNPGEGRESAFGGIEKFLKEYIYR